MRAGIGNRVAQALPDGVTQKEVAAQVGMTPDAFSRALNGERGFSAVELANLAEFLGEDVYYLITGETDPHKLVLSARHSYDPGTRERTVDGHDQDRHILDDIALAYRQADEAPAPSQIPVSLAAARGALGADFVSTLLDKLEKRFGIDVIRVSGLSTAYSFHIGERAVVAIPATGNWFRENYDMAHELGHLVLRHHRVIATGSRVEGPESDANRFGAELLLPEATMSAVDWQTIASEELASLVWRLGVSTAALRIRLAALHLATSPQVERLLQTNTQALLRRHWRAASLADEITQRMQKAAQRHFPLWLQEAHLNRIAEGAVGKATLAWMLGVDEAELDVETPEAPAAPTAAELDDLLG